MTEREAWADAAQCCQAITDELRKGMEIGVDGEPRWPDGDVDWETVEDLACGAWERLYEARQEEIATGTQWQEDLAHLIALAALMSRAVTMPTVEIEEVYAGHRIATAIAEMITRRAAREKTQ